VELFSDSPIFNGMDAHELNPIIVRRGKVNNLMMFFIMENVNVVVNTNMGHRTKRILRIERKEYQTY
jgi:hypothetical protein